jgi:hypothetical protein
LIFFCKKKSKTPPFFLLTKARICGFYNSVYFNMAA